MRIALVLLLVGLLGLVGTSAFWLRTGRPLPPDQAGITRLLSELPARAATTIDLDRRYAGRGELLVPSEALPSWHRYPHDAAAAVFHATRACPTGAAGDVEPALAKALRFHDAACAGGGAELVEQAPFIHPSGASYAALAGKSRDFVVAHQRAFHVLELPRVARDLPDALDAESRVLASFPLATWEAFARGDALVLTPDSFVRLERSARGLGVLHRYPRQAFERLASSHRLALVSREATALCARPASPTLCWEERPGSRLLGFSTGGSAMLVILSVALLAALRVQERRQAHADRIHVLRTLTHELRTPAMSLGLDIEPLRAAYDELPANCQEPVLRLSDGIERLSRVLHRSARYMALFETSNARVLLSIERIPSIRALFEDCQAEWPEGISLGGTDIEFSTDAEWLGVALRNLAENASRHGKPPITVRWEKKDNELVVRIVDGGASPDLHLPKAAMPYARGEKSDGLGLGLAIVTRIATLLGGTLTHRPAPTTFELRLPDGGPPA